MNKEILQAETALENLFNNLKNNTGSPLVSYWIIRNALKEIRHNETRRLAALLRKKEIED